MLIDVTGSMGGTLQAVKDTVILIFNLLVEFLESQGYPEGCFEMMIGLFRNYNSGEDVFVHSDFSAQPKVLREFLEKYNAGAGSGA